LEKKEKWARIPQTGDDKFALVPKEWKASITADHLLGAQRRNPHCMISSSTSQDLGTKRMET
jgi:hypothetical protein